MFKLLLKVDLVRLQALNALRFLLQSIVQIAYLALQPRCLLLGARIGIDLGLNFLQVDSASPTSVSAMTKSLFVFRAVRVRIRFRPGVC